MISNNDIHWYDWLVGWYCATSSIGWADPVLG